ncbi:MAG: PepSY domain-containing protein [Pseudomonadales bacterium]|nr:PepSY domain-containing protein [Pseudomonadales bacterium]MDP6471987.1 PepSY domain-containing protein [Pseudomonadales bacterium]MDP6826742.1 PepSY domain-containing protein [Pseudomonadales bacterium]MDP6972676.1 PepSY domain-containing protein [Pseudomonadales bacterium]
MNLVRTIVHGSAVFLMAAVICLSYPSAHGQNAKHEERGAEWRNEPRSNTFASPPGTRARLSAEKATTIARRETGGRILSATAVDGGKKGYRVRLLMDGRRVVTVHVTGTGRIKK